MNPESILTLSKEHRKTFVWLLIVLFLLALVLDWRLSSLPLTDAVLGYVRALAASILTALFVLWVVSSFIPLNKPLGGLVELEAGNITTEFDRLLSTATRWRYKGNFGRYMRGKVLPTLAGRQNCHISVCVIDPRNRVLCEKHAQYRGQINSIDKGKKYNTDSVALEVLVTIVICAWYSVNHRVHVDLYLSASFDPVRIDSNDEAMILTVEDRRSPALMVKKSHFTYEHFETSMEFARNQGDQVSLQGVRSGIGLAQLEEQDVTAVLTNSGMGDLCKHITPEVILQACRESKNPYEN
ncbi:hypothetical protein CWI75_04665 [Kineobactrum sediminis]|uniref:Uncharacterized protein n=1 Tax=Kineobactrum sediminis TaxID=1905677 RepID=A0A2N5Y5H6_9GAMM|nr:hypothetical protein [Kineobactrum sediminis]PLW83646.1 hypothetical protein CWI75_04665 [Kineobactrum sediminis]